MIDIIKFLLFHSNKPASLAYAARQADTLRLPEAPGVTLIKYRGI